jgi:D-alanine-D-alanine ligase
MTSPTLIKNPARFGRVAVLLGGTSSEREVSLDSGRNVLEALQRRGVDATAVDGIPALVAALTQPDGPRFDRVFNILHGNRGGGEDGVLQGLLEALGIPYTGSGVLGSALSMDKIRTKQVWLAIGLPTPAYVSLQRGEDVVAAAHKIGLPVIVKPACEGSSVGVTRCFHDSDLPEAVALAARYEGSLLVEQLIQGEEFTVGILGTEAHCLDSHRAGRRVLRLSREVRRDRHAIPLPRSRRCGGAGNGGPRARVVFRCRLQRLGSRGHHA